MIYNTLKAALIVAVLTVAAGQWLYSQADRRALERLVSDGFPLTTGSVGQASDRSAPQGFAAFPGDSLALRLDPCAVQPAR